MKYELDLLRAAHAPPCEISHRDQLPSSIQAIGDMLGDTGLLALLEAHGGTRIYVPEKVGYQDPLSELLGEEVAQKFVREYGRDTLTIPLCKTWRVIMLHAQGLSYAATGRRLGMHEQSVYKIVKVHKNGRGGVPVRPPIKPHIANLPKQSYGRENCTVSRHAVSHPREVLKPLLDAFKTPLDGT